MYFLSINDTGDCRGPLVVRELIPIDFGIWSTDFGEITEVFSCNFFSFLDGSIQIALIVLALVY